ncbi:hypothetical protein OWR28_18650 [Chryseobacterium sp. 1B4]
MKKIISGISIFCAIAVSAQESIQFQELPFKDIIAKAKKEKNWFLLMPMLPGADRAK